MALSPENQQQVKQYLADKGFKLPVCSICGTRNWIDNSIIQPPGFIWYGAPPAPHSVMPRLVVFQCEGCAQVLLLDAEKMGLTPS